MTKEKTTMINHSGILLSVSENPNQTKEGKYIKIIKYHNEDPYAGSRIIYFD